MLALPSHPTRVRGLKSEDYEATKNLNSSHPTRVRGLKSDGTQVTHDTYYVAPYTGTWIEITLPLDGHKLRWSHPTRVRGLKLLMSRCHNIPMLVAPYTGAWIEIYTVTTQNHIINVAPYTGAWIEILCLLMIKACYQSHPTRVRGLKYIFKAK